MGYTHYWNNSKQITPDLVDATTKILAKAKERGIPLAYEYDLPDAPPVVSEIEIRFNGLLQDGHETFHFEQTSFGFCKTNYKPYDTVVVAVLSVAAHLGLAEVRSDGDSAEWQDGVSLAREATGLPIRVPKSVAGDADTPPIGWYDWHTASCAEVPHIAVYRHEGDGDETRIADFYIEDGKVAEAEGRAIRLVNLLNADVSSLDKG
jgi:hypothetical protein